MIFLPIVERELRVAARRPSTYHTRWSAALGALVMAGFVYLTQRGWQFPARLGHSIFSGISGLTPELLT